MESIFDIQQKEDSLKKLQEVKNIDAKYLLSAKEINIIVSTIKNLMYNIGSVNTLDEVLEAGGYSERSATVGNFRAKEIQVGESFIPESSGALFRIQKNSDGTISIIFDSVSQTDSDNFGRLTSTLSNNDGVEFRHLENDNSQGAIARIRKDGVLFTLINSWLKVNKDGVYRDVLLSGLAEIADVIGLQNNLDNKADLVEGLVPQAQSQGSTLTMDPTTYKIQFEDARGSVQIIDLPIESLFKDANYDSDTKTLYLTLDNGSTIEVPLEDLVDLPEIQIALEFPAVLPSGGQKVWFHYNKGHIYVNVDGEWQFFGKAISNIEFDQLTASYIHSKKTNENPHETKLVQLKDWDNTLMTSILADSMLILQNKLGTFYRVPWEAAKSSIPTLNDFIIRRKGITIYDEFTNQAVSGSPAPFIRSTFNSGTIGTNTLLDVDHPGLIQVASSTTTTNGGGSILLNNTTTARSMVVTPGIQFDIIIFSNAFSNNVFYRFGFLSGSVNPQDITDGFYFEWNGANLIGKTATGSVRSSTSTYTMASATWYHLRCKMINASNVIFEVYDMNGSIIWSSNLTTNVPPIGTGTQPGFIGFNQIAENKTMCVIDYMSVTFPPMNRGALT